ncbi:MAG: hypothetical protein K9J13_11305 [Saprospiraceae bacterium]|nr:hypothetical protein [Saprospiraceae bacterium]
MEFKEEVRALMGQYNNNIKVLTDDSTVQIFQTAFKTPTWQIRATNANKLRKGCFYIIKYNYNGNKIWCPILSLEYKVKDNKNILYAINLDYLPYEYKILFISSLFKANKNCVDKNRDIQNVLEEKSLDARIENVYRWLQTNGSKEYSLTGFDVLKIVQIYAVSTTILDRFIFLNTKYINKRMMLDTLEGLDNQNLRLEMQSKIQKYQELLELYEKDVELFYRALRNFEANLKLFDE